MKKEERTKLEPMAFELYAHGTSCTETAIRLEVSKRTILRWKSKYDWDERLKDIEEKTRSKQSESIAETKDRHLKLMREMMSKFAQQIKNENFKITPNEIIRVCQYENLLLGINLDEDKESQEQGKVYQFVVEDPKTGKIIPFK